MEQVQGKHKKGGIGQLTVAADRLAFMLSVSPPQRQPLLS
jgi:hypothetical protein